MNLEKTELLLNRKLWEKNFDSYGVLVSVNDEKNFYIPAM